jgi:hypothetical protein
MKPIAARRRPWTILLGLLLAYLVLAYLILPVLWKHHEHEPGLASLPMVTRTASDIPGDALNVGLVGTKEDVLRAMHAAGWFPADPITLRTSIEIVGSVVLDRPYHDAPVSPLYYEGKKDSRSKNLMAGAPTGDITFDFGRCSIKGRTVVRCGLVRSRLIEASV